MLETRVQELQDRLISKAYLVESGCWEWHAAIGTHGYGVLTFNKQHTLAHRASYKAFVCDIVDDMMVKHNLVDTYRKINTYGGFTWGRNNPRYLRSRLDHIIVSKSISNSLVTSTTTNEINESDHTLLISEFLIESCPYGPGITRTNSSLLEQPEIKERIIINLNEEINNMPKEWNPHQRLDYYKYKLRLNMLKEGKERSKRNRGRLELANQEIDRLKRKLDEILINVNYNVENIQS